MQTALPRRKNVRRQGWDSASPGLHSLTVCTLNMRSVFGTVVNGRMILSEAGLDAPNARRGVWCNQYAIEHGGRLVVGHINPDGMLACLFSEVGPERDIHSL